jgi:hypothetical protein
LAGNRYHPEGEVDMENKFDANFVITRDEFSEFQKQMKSLEKRVNKAEKMFEINEIQQQITVLSERFEKQEADLHLLSLFIAKPKIVEHQKYLEKVIKEQFFNANHLLYDHLHNFLVGQTTLAVHTVNESKEPLVALAEFQISCHQYFSKMGVKGFQEDK